MAKLALNKTTLNNEGRRLKAFKQFVPALDLKRKQLLSARQEAVAALAHNQAQLAQLQQEVVDLNALIQIKTLDIRYANLGGLELPKLAAFEVEIANYSTLLLPHWVDAFLNLQKKALKTEIEVQVYQQRLALLEAGLQKTTQRLNLFDKVLIPEAQKNIRKIRIALSDAERAGVVRAKIAKNKRRRIQL